MRATGVLAAAAWIAVAGCGRSPLKNQARSDNGDASRRGVGFDGGVNGEDRDALARDASLSGSGGSAGATRGSGGSAGGNAGTNRSGGATGVGGISGSGGRSSTGGVGPGTGGQSQGGGGGRSQGGTGGSGGRSSTGGTTGGTLRTGGTSGTGAVAGRGGAMTSGGTIGTAGSRSGGASTTGGVSASGGVGSTSTLGAGGTAGGGGRTASGGAFGGAGTTASGGSLDSGGAMTSGGSVTSGGTSASGGTVGTGGSTGTGGGLTGGNTGVGGTGGSAAMCGDGTVDSGEQCDQGPENQVSAAFWVTQSGYSIPVTPLLRSASNVDFYSYSSVSAHTGFEALGTSRIMLYLDRNTGLLSLILFHGIDQDSSGEDQPKSLVVMQFIGLPETTTVDVVDDDGSNEFTMVSATEGTGYWNFTGNTDGVALGHLPFPGDWTTTITPAFRSGISVWTWIDGNGTAVLLDLSQPITIQARGSHGGCRSNCSIPRCGDGILDGGEICDDGQPSTIGCGADCKSFD